MMNMKRMILLLAVAVLFSFTSCEKESSIVFSEDQPLFEADADLATKLDWDFYYTGDPGYPEKSVSGKVILGSAGCCFRARNVSVRLIEDNGRVTPLFSGELVENHDTYECNDIPEINGPFHVAIDFVEEYFDTKEISIEVAEFSSTEELLKDGLLLCFSDGELEVFIGESRSLFKAGIFRKDEYGPWYQES